MGSLRWNGLSNNRQKDNDINNNNNNNNNNNDKNYKNPRFVWYFLVVC